VLVREYFWVCFTAAMVGLAIVWGVTLMLLRASIAHARKKPAGEEKGAARGTMPKNTGT
jgi:heme/copper-type cytochrome/quinol oxidase subunit 2